MLSVFSALMAYVVSHFRSHDSLRLENMALRHQLAVYQHTVKRPKLRPSDRLFWAWLSRLWPGWQHALAVRAAAHRDRVAEETVSGLLATTQPERHAWPAGHCQRSPRPHPGHVALQSPVGIASYRG